MIIKERLGSMPKDLEVNQAQNYGLEVLLQASNP
jgi:hypothetical protein